MAVSKKFAAAALAVVAVGLTATGVVLAATDPNPGGTQRDLLALNGYPPRSAQLRVVVSTGQAYDVTADVNVNFVTNAVSAQLHVPLGFSAARIDLRLVGGNLYASSPSLGALLGSKWLSTTSTSASLYGLSLEMTRPDISLISGFPEETVTHDGSYTTYAYHRDNVAITAPTGLPVVMPTHAAIDFSITLGRQNELTAIELQGDLGALDRVGDGDGPLLQQGRPHRRAAVARRDAGQRRSDREPVRVVVPGQPAQPQGHHLPGPAQPQLGPG